MENSSFTAGSLQTNQKVVFQKSLESIIDYSKFRSTREITNWATQLINQAQNLDPETQKSKRIVELKKDLENGKIDPTCVPSAIKEILRYSKAEDEALILKLTSRIQEELFDTLKKSHDIPLLDPEEAKAIKNLQKPADLFDVRIYDIGCIFIRALSGYVFAMQAFRKQYKKQSLESLGYKKNASTYKSFMAISRVLEDFTNVKSSSSENKGLLIVPFSNLRYVIQLFIEERKRVESHPCNEFIEKHCK